MKEKKSDPTKMARRCFLANCAKFAAGASLLSYSLDSMGNTNDSYEDYAYCIYKCPSPCTYDSECIGCRDDDTGARATCTVRNCAISKELPSCAHCAELAVCEKDLWINYPAQRQFALNKQNEWGLLTGTVPERTKKDAFHVHPTITTDGFTIQNLNQLKVDYKLFNIKGQIVNTGKSSSKEQYVDISNLPSGSYVLYIVKNNELLHLNRIIKN